MVHIKKSVYVCDQLNLVWAVLFIIKTLHITKKNWNQREQKKSIWNFRISVYMFVLCSAHIEWRHIQENAFVMRVTNLLFVRQMTKWNRINLNGAIQYVWKCPQRKRKYHLESKNKYQNGTEKDSFEFA